MTGIPEMLVLRLLSRQPMHGYAVVQAIKRRSEEKLQFGEGSIYPILHRLEGDKMLKTSRTMVNGRERVVYSITASGKKRLSEYHSLWEQVVIAVDAVF
ncbi:MAG: helix-turn-helix transcriptional regulator [Planctomycetota bacterium]